MPSCKATSHNGFQSRKKRSQGIFKHSASFCLLLISLSCTSSRHVHHFHIEPSWAMKVHLFWPMSHIGAWHQSVALQLGHENTRSLNSETSELTNNFKSQHFCAKPNCSVAFLTRGNTFFEGRFLSFPPKNSWPASHRLDLHMGQRDSWVKAISTVFWHVPHFWNTFFWNSEGLWYQYRCSSQFCYETNNQYQYVSEYIIFCTVYNSKYSSIYFQYSIVRVKRIFGWTCSSNIAIIKNENGSLACTKVKESMNPRRC